MATKKLTRVNIEDEAIRIVKGEKTQWEESVCFVTEKVAFQMRFLIRQLRKNYWGIYDIPDDSSTQRRKTWVPLTESAVEDVVKSIDLDTKDINFRAKTPRGYAITDVIRSVTREYLEKNNFGRKLDEMERNLAIDGTIVWKTYEGKDEKGKPKLIVKNVDLLNVYIDPTEDNIQDAYRFTERGLLLPSEIEKMTGWENTKGISASKGLAKIDSSYQTISSGTTGEYVDVWEMWGKIPRSLVTGLREDTEEINGHIVVSGLETGDVRCHLIKENTKCIKPYEECRYSKIANRWYGKGIAEKLLGLQIWMNTIINIRINRSYITQLGLHKIKRGSNITPQMLSRLAANGAILVNNMDDIQPLEMPSADEASYRDEEVINNWSQKVTSAYNAAVGEPTPASSTATANVLQDRNAKSAFTLVKESIGMFLQRWIDLHALPVIAKTVNIGDLVRFSKDDESFKELITYVVAYEAMQNLEESYKKGFIPTHQQMQMEMMNAEKRLSQKDMFVKVVDTLIAEHVQTQVFVTNEEMDIGVTVQNLLQVMQIAPEYRESTVKEIYDLMGLSEPKMSAPQQPQGQAPQGAPMPQGQSLQSLTTAANVPQL